MADTVSNDDVPAEVGGPDTAPHRVTELPGFEVGRRAGAAHAEGEHRRGVLEGREQVLDALRLAFRSLEVAGDIPANVEAWVRSRLPPA